jgi:translation initiation factor 4E
VLQVDKARRAELIDYYWLELLMAMIGEQYEDLGAYICGAVVNVRTKGDKVSLWTRDCTKTDVNRRIGYAHFFNYYAPICICSEILKAKLSIEETLYYEAHDDAKIKQSSSIKHSLYV